MQILSQPISHLITVLFSIVFSIVVLAFSTQLRAADVKDAFLISYLEASEALASDKALTPSQLSKINESAKAMGLEDEVISAAKQLAAQPDIKAQRKAFKKLSIQAISYAEKSGVKGIFKANCPMANADWLQLKEPVRNPYYGSKMLACGSSEAL